MNISFWKFFRMVFVIFSLYLLGDVFYRWDGFTLHSTFVEFIPSVALAAIQWSIVALLASVLVWVFLVLIIWICRRTGIEISVEHLIIYSAVLIIAGALVWKGKKLFLPDLQTTTFVKISVLVSVISASAFLSWLFRNKAERWVGIVQERITPLVWLFGTFVLISFPLVTYYMLSKATDKDAPKTTVRSSIDSMKRPNIILVTFDALSAKDMSAYGYQRPTTPFISAWAKDAVLFTNLKASSNWTVPTTASLMTGKRQWTHRVAQFQGAIPDKSSIESLPLLLKENGYFNMAFISNTLASVKALGIDNSFDIAPLPIEFSIPHSLVGDGLNVFGTIDKLLYRQFSDRFILHDWLLKEDFILGKFLNIVSRNISFTTTPPAVVFDKFFEVRNNDASEPYFAWIHIFPPHDPYLPPQPFKGLFDASDQFRTYKSQDAVRLESHKYLFRFQPYPPEMQPSMDLLRSHYDEFIRYCDNEFENFVKRLSAGNNLDNTMIILSADHGESFENGYHLHGGPFLNEAVTHIPLIVKVPGKSKGMLIHELVEQVDIPATVLDLAGIPVPAWMEGRSLLPLLTGGSLLPGPVFSMNLRMSPQRSKKIENGSFAVWEGDYKLVHILDEKWRKTFLYNLKNDPDEFNNIFEKETETGQRLLNLILQNLNIAR